MKEFFRIYFQTIYKPRKTFEWLVTQENVLKWSLGFILIPVILYTLMYIFLTVAGGAPSVFTPWLNISRENYYAINRFLLAPSMILCWFAASSFIQVASRLSGGRGAYENTLATVALSISIAMLGGLLHDLPMSFLSAVGVIDARQHEIDMNSPTIFRTLLWICYSLYFIGFLFFFPLAVKTVHKFSWIKSVLIGVPGFVIFQVVFFVFNR
jgi:hypothetical protein